jgi:hypothetical protein
MKKWGLSLLLLGLLSSILPILGFQFHIFNIFGEGQAAVALLLIGIGIVLFFVGKFKESGFTNEKEVSLSPEQPVEEVQGLSCSACGEEITTDDQFCGSCGGRVERAEPIKKTTPAACTSCGTLLSPDEQFCGECGHKVTLAEPIKETPIVGPSAPKARRRRKSSLAILIVFVLIIGGLFAAYYYHQPKKSQQSKSQNGISVPSEGDIAQLKTLMTQAEQEWRQMKGTGGKPKAVYKSEMTAAEQKANNKAQEWAHYRNAISHVEKMRKAYMEMLAAEKAGDKVAAQSAAHTYQHYRGELSILRSHAKSLPDFLDSKIQQWTEN